MTPTFSQAIREVAKAIAPFTLGPFSCDNAEEQILLLLQQHLGPFAPPDLDKIDFRRIAEIDNLEGGKIDALTRPMQPERCGGSPGRPNWKREESLVRRFRDWHEQGSICDQVGCHRCPGCVDCLQPAPVMTPLCPIHGDGEPCIPCIEKEPTPDAFRCAEELGETAIEFLRREFSRPKAASIIQRLLDSKDARADLLEAAFAHMFVMAYDENDDPTDTCQTCRLNVRDQIHYTGERKGESK